MVPVPMASRLVLMPVLPSVTVSEAENFDGKGWVARAVNRSLRVSQAAPTPAAERIRNSRGCIRPPAGQDFFMIHRFGDHSIVDQSDRSIIRTASETQTVAAAFSRVLFSVPPLHFPGWQCDRQLPKNSMAFEPSQLLRSARCRKGDACSATL